jgi:predicted methyltransferase
MTCALLLACGGAQQPAPSAPQATPSASAAVSAEDKDALAAAIAGDHRAEKNRVRDPYRHPHETLTFFGVQPQQRVIELWPGGGWYTEILAPMLRQQGSLTAVAATGPYLQPYKDFLATRTDLYDRVTVLEVSPPNDMSFGPDGSADVVLTFRNLHSWINNGYADQVLSAAFRALKPGGVLGVTDHRANPGTSAEQSAKSGYVSEEAAIALATGVGFVLEERSEVNANPKDTKDHPNGVWSLPPSLRGGDSDKDKFVAIGESDRMTLRFRKPAR